jgi:hypothetical protein
MTNCCFELRFTSSFKPGILRLSLVIGLVAIAIGTALSQPAYTSFRPGELWYDTDSNIINAHGGGILFHQGVYYWFGEYRYGYDRPPQQHASPGVSCYSSTDLYNWTFRGIVMKTVEEQGNDIERGAIVERPKVIYNKQTGRFVMWFHLELKGQGYASARAAVAVANSPAGPYEFLESKRPLAGQWPQGFNENQPQPVAGKDSLEWWTPKWYEAVRNGLFVRRDFKGGQMSRDQTVFVDRDGTAYQIAASEENLTLHIRELTADYLDFTGNWLQIFPGGHNEAPAIFEYEGNYYLIASGATGWKPNAARSFTAPSMWGPWKALGNPAKGINPKNGIGPEKTFGGQSTYILPVQGKPGAYIAMFDMWRPRNQTDSRYIWLPIKIEDGRFIVEWLNKWDLSYFD